MKRYGYLLLCLTLMSCATPQELCSRPNIAEHYPDFDACVAAVEAGNQRRANAFRNMANYQPQPVVAGPYQSNGTQPIGPYSQPSNNEPIKQTDYKCLNQCTSGGYQYGFCQSKCSY